MSKTGFEKSLEGEQKWPPAKAKVVKLSVDWLEVEDKMGEELTTQIVFNNASNRDTDQKVL